LHTLNVRPRRTRELSDINTADANHYPPRTGFDRLVSNIIKIAAAVLVVTLCAIIAQYFG
jgi:hypothetical protein